MIMAVAAHPNGIGSRRRRSRIVAVAAVLAAVAAHAQSFFDGPTIHELAARNDVAGLARAVNGGVPVDVRDDQGETALHVAAREVHLFAVMMLVTKGANVNARDGRRRTPLHLAVEDDTKKRDERFQIVKLLVAKGADRSALDTDGRQPVDYATTVEFRRALAPPVTAPAGLRPR
jgi:ankyrin repeat protein